MIGIGGNAGNFEGRIFVIAGPGNVGADAHELHSGESFQARREGLIKMNLAGVVGITLAGKLNVEGERVVGIEAGIEVLKVDEGAQEKTGTGEKDESDSNFGGDGNVAEAPASSAGSGASVRVFEGFVGVGLDHPASGGQAGK